jgi:hypothetical protein
VRAAGAGFELTTSNIGSAILLFPIGAGNGERQRACGEKSRWGRAYLARANPPREVAGTLPGFLTQKEKGRRREAAPSI